MFRKNFKITLRKKYLRLERSRGFLKQYKIKPIMLGTGKESKLFMVCTINGNMRQIKDANTIDLLLSNTRALDSYAYSLMLGF